MVLYTNNVPQATQTIAATQPTIQSNFTYLPLFGNVDHDFASDSATTTNGFHTKVTFKANGSAPGFGSGVSVAYADTVAGVSSLCFENGTGSFAITGKNPSSASNGYTCLPGSLLLQWGFHALSGGTSDNGTVSFPVAFSSAAYNVQLTLRCVSGGTSSSNNTLCVRNTSITTTGFDFVYNGSGADFSLFFWTAIGPSV